MTEFTAEDRELMEEAAEALVKRRLAVPSMMFLETVSPMNMVTAAMLHVMSPAWRIALPASRIDAIAKLLERREAIPELIRVIDEAEEKRLAEERAQRKTRSRRRWLPWKRDRSDDRQRNTP